MEMFASFEMEGEKEANKIRIALTKAGFSVSQSTTGAPNAPQTIQIHAFEEVKKWTTIHTRRKPPLPTRSNL